MDDLWDGSRLVLVGLALEHAGALRCWFAPAQGHFDFELVFAAEVAGYKARHHGIGQGNIFPENIW